MRTLLKQFQKNRKFSQTDRYSSWKVRCCHLFITYHNFPTFFVNPKDQVGVKKGKKIRISLKDNPQMQNICTSRYFFKINSMVSHIFDRILYSATLGSPGIQWGQKMPPCISIYVYKHFFQNKNFMTPVHHVLSKIFTLH